MAHVIDYPRAADHGGDLPPQFDWPRKQEPLPGVRLPDGRTAWLVTRHEHVRTVLASEKFTRDIPVPGKARSYGDESVMRTVNMDGHPHAELRGLVSRAFTVRQIDSMRPHVQELTDSLLDSMERNGPPADLVCHLSAPLPAVIICELLGFPIADHETLRHWCDLITTVGGGDGFKQAWLDLSGYIDRVVQEKRADMEKGGPADADLLTTLIHAHDTARRLTWEELVSLTVVILAGGLETTETAISAGLLRLFRNPDQTRRLRDDPRLLDAAIEEILRYQPVIDLNRLQVATEDAWLGERFVRTGDLVQVSINAANRDDETFPEAARFDIAREPNPHLAFGHGAHHCLGAALARLELKTAFSSLFRRFPALSLAVPVESLRWRGGHVTLRLMELPVAW